MPAFISASNLESVQSAQHEDGVGEHDEVAASHQECVEEDCLRADVREALAGVRDDAGRRGGGVQGDLHKLVLPGEADPVIFFSKKNEKN